MSVTTEDSSLILNIRRIVVWYSQFIRKLTVENFAFWETTQVTTGWRGHIGCLKLQVIFRKRANNYRALLRTMTYKDKASYASSPPCTGWRRDIGCLIFMGHFPQKSPIISGSFAENDLQLKASYESPLPCTEVSTEVSSLILKISSIVVGYSQLSRKLTVENFAF